MVKMVSLRFIRICVYTYTYIATTQNEKERVPKTDKTLPQVPSVKYIFWETFSDPREAMPVPQQGRPEFLPFGPPSSTA
jgi:hypothetical protein